MYPLIEIPPLGVVRTHTVMLVLAVAVAVSLSHRWCIHAGLAPRRVRAALLVIGVFTLLGGRLHFVLAHWEMFEPHPWTALSPSSGNLHAPGALLAAVVSGALCLPLLGVPACRFLDAVGMAAGFGVAIARLGCFLHGCCFGTASDLPWAVRFPQAEILIRSLQVDQGLLPPQATEALPVRPLQLYFAAAALAIAGLLLWRRSCKRFDGELGLVFLVLFSASSAALELLRAELPQRTYWGPLPELLWVTAAMTVLSTIVLVAAEYRHGPRSKRA